MTDEILTIDDIAAQRSYARDKVVKRHDFPRPRRRDISMLVRTYYRPTPEEVARRL